MAQPAEVQPGEFKAAFSQWIREGTRVRAALHEQRLEEWGEQLPGAELADLRAALHEALAAEAEAAAEEVPAAENEEPAPQA